ncbi:MAG: hypothetical protein ACE5KX_09185 [Acidimicrobiia bacterium]
MDAAEPAASVVLAAEVFDVLAGRLAKRSETIALFAETGSSFQEWCVWEGLSAGRARGWTVRPKPGYAEVGVAGSRDAADLLVFDPASGQRVLLELAIIHDWTTNKWIDELNGDTARLGRPLAGGIVPLQAILAVCPHSPIDVNPTWQGWLGMSAIWNRPTELKRVLRLGPVGQLVLKGWVMSIARRPCRRD